SIMVEVSRLLLDLDRPVLALTWLESALEENASDVDVLGLYQTALRRVEAGVSAPVADRSTKEAAPTDALPRLPGAGNSAHRPARRDDKSAADAPRFVDRHDQAGVDFQYFNGAGGAKYLLETLGGGVGAFDFDGDGWPDLYFTQGCPLPIGEGGSDTW